MLPKPANQKPYNALCCLLDLINRRAPVSPLAFAQKGGIQYQTCGAYNILHLEFFGTVALSEHLGNHRTLGFNMPVKKLWSFHFDIFYRFIYFAIAGADHVQIL
jgi:hypothetical protein